MNTPLIKWTGSKRPIAEQIVSYFPKSIETYYEPFLGGGSIFFQLLKNKADIKKFELSDKNESLIDIFKIVKDDPKELISSYESKWEKLQKDPNYYYTQRELYNKNKDPMIFYFLTRTCYNGTIRYNKSGGFNTSHHFGRTGMIPKKVEDIISYYHNLMVNSDINFTSQSFEQIVPTTKNDVVYLDPPYTNTKALYYGNIVFDDLISWISEFDCSWFMNINGINSTDNEENVNIPYTGREVFNSGNSSFSRMKGKSVNVCEYFYYNLV